MSRRGWAFVMVGACGFAVQSAVLVALTWNGWSVAPATAVAVECAILANFLWHERWTWRDRITTGRARVERLLRFHAANGVNSLVGSVALTWLAAHHFGLPVVVANALSVAIVAGLNFRAADRWVFRATALAISGLTLMPATASADGVSAKTLDAWTAHVRAVESSLDSEPAQASSSQPDGRSIDVPDGTISDWRGRVVIRHRTVAQVVDALVLSGELPHAEEVVDARILSRQGDALHTFMRLRRRALITVTYDTEHDVRYTRHSPTLATSRSVATRIIESDGRDRGFLWRLNSYWRYQQVGPDVRIDLRSLTLSRSVPWLTRPIAMPIVDRIGRESIRSTLDALARFLSDSGATAH